MKRILIATIACVQAARPRAPGDPHYPHDVADVLRKARDVVDDAAARATGAGVERARA